MADITSDCTFREGVVGDLKFLVITTPATAATGDTIDLASDATDGRGVKMSKILNTLAQDDLGADVTTTWVPSTGIITLGTITTGIHDITVVGY